MVRLGIGGGKSARAASATQPLESPVSNPFLSELGSVQPEAEHAVTALTAAVAARTWPVGHAVHTTAVASVPALWK